MGTRYLIDSNIAIQLLNGSLSPDALRKVQAWLQAECNVSLITRIEVLDWQFPSPLKQQEAEKFFHACSLYRVTDPIAEQAILIRRKVKIKLPDAAIAATALVNNFSLITRNVSDFSKIPGLTVVNPFII